MDALVDRLNATFGRLAAIPEGPTSDELLSALDTHAPTQAATPPTYKSLENRPPTPTALDDDDDLFCHEQLTDDENEDELMETRRVYDAMLTGLALQNGPVCTFLRWKEWHENVKAWESQ